MILTRGDYGRLEPSEFLNDNLVDFYLKHLTRERFTVGQAGKRPAGTPLPAAAHAKAFHVFTAHFYKKLTGKVDQSLIEAAAASALTASAASTASRSAGSDDDDDEEWRQERRPGKAQKRSSSSAATAAKAAAVREAKEAAAHANVARWTKEMNLFEMQFVFVPIVEHLHWSLAVVANLDNLENHWKATRRRAAAAAVAAAEKEAAAAAEAEVELVEVGDADSPSDATPDAAEPPADEGHKEIEEGADAAMGVEEEIESVEEPGEAKLGGDAMEVSTSAEGEGKRGENNHGESGANEGALGENAEQQLEDVPDSPVPALLTNRLRKKSGKQPSNAAQLFDNVEVAEKSESSKAAVAAAQSQPGDKEVENQDKATADQATNVLGTRAQATTAISINLEDGAAPKAAAATPDDVSGAGTEAVDDSERAPCLVFMDSLNMHAAKKVALHLRAYLKHEWRAKRASRQAAATAALAKSTTAATAAAGSGGNSKGNNEPAGGEKVVESTGSDTSSSSSSSSSSSDNNESDVDDEAAFEAYVDTLFGGPSGSTIGDARVAPLPLLRPPVPRQTNCCDCGVFCVQYVEELLLRWPAVDDAQLESGCIEGFGKAMFSALQMQQKRDAIRRRIDELSRS